MKRHKTRYSKNFDVGNHIVNIELFTQCVTSNPQERSYRKKLCKVVFSNPVKDGNREFIQIYFSSMRAAAVFIANHIDTHIMKFNIFGKQYDAYYGAVLSCNYKLYDIYSVSDKDVLRSIFLNDD